MPPIGKYIWEIQKRKILQILPTLGGHIQLARLWLRQNIAGVALSLVKAAGRRAKVGGVSQAFFGDLWMGYLTQMLQYLKVTPIGKYIWQINLV